MAVIKQTIYRCDSCGSEVESNKDLKRIYVQWGRKRSYYEDRPGIKADFCGACLAVFAAQGVKPFFGEKGYNEIYPPVEKEAE